MGNPVVHVEVVGQDAPALRSFYGALFGWEFDTSAPVSGEVSDPGEYGFADGDRLPDGSGTPVGVGGGEGRSPHLTWYVGVPDVGAALAEAERLGGVRCMGPDRGREGLVVAHFTDPEGNLVGLAGPA